MEKKRRYLFTDEDTPTPKYKKTFSELDFFIKKFIKDFYNCYQNFDIFRLLIDHLSQKFNGQILIWDSKTKEMAPELKEIFDVTEVSLPINYKAVPLPCMKVYLKWKEEGRDLISGIYVDLYLPNGINFKIKQQEFNTYILENININGEGFCEAHMAELVRFFSSMRFSWDVKKQLFFLYIKKV